MSTSLLTTHKKNAHLTKEERVMIATLKSEGISNRSIGRQLGVNHQTINNELNRGTVRQLRRQKSNGKVIMGKDIIKVLCLFQYAFHRLDSTLFFPVSFLRGYNL